MKRSHADLASAKSAAHVDGVDETSGISTKFSARFGGVVEFPEEPKENKMSKKRQKGKKPGPGTEDDSVVKQFEPTQPSTGIRVLGTQPWCEFFIVFTRSVALVSNSIRYVTDCIVGFYRPLSH